MRRNGPGRTLDSFGKDQDLAPAYLVPTIQLIIIRDMHSDSSKLLRGEKDAGNLK
jgi:hypothetical protein